MSGELRYDGPDVEAEASQRVSSALMGATMLLDGLSGAWAKRAQAADAARTQQAEAVLAADRALWRDTPPAAQLAGLGDQALAERWAAAAAHPDQADAHEARMRVEAELDRRDPETMRDYRSWRHGAALPPGEAMRRALAEREERLRGVWAPLLDTGAAGMPAGEVADRWAAAHSAHGLDGATARDLVAAREAGRARLAVLDPARLDGWAALQAPLPSAVPGLGDRPGLSAAEAAARAAGRPAAFLPAGDGTATGWSRVAVSGVRVATTTARATPTAPAALAVDAATAVAARLHHTISRGMAP